MNVTFVKLNIKYKCLVGLGEGSTLPYTLPSRRYNSPWQASATDKIRFHRSVSNPAPLTAPYNLLIL